MRNRLLARQSDERERAHWSGTISADWKGEKMYFVRPPDIPIIKRYSGKLLKFSTFGKKNYFR